MASREPAPDFAAQERGVGAGDADFAAAIEKSSHEALPFGDFLHFIQEDGRASRGEFFQDGEERREVLRRQAVEPRVLEVAVKGPFPSAHHLRLLDALPAPAHARQDDGVRGPGGNPGGQVPRRLGVGRERGAGVAEDVTKCIS
jgi:hypothetical protein